MPFISHLKSLADADTPHTHQIKQVQGLKGVTSLAFGQMHSLAGTAIGRMFSWGTDEFGALGRGEESMLVSGSVCFVSVLLCVQFSELVALVTTCGDKRAHTLTHIHTRNAPDAQCLWHS